ncbi:hypothetical protein TraAM80_08320 [Trypanosoma rangeli]|uniref:Uncharacterized protein n=1 Tax=Trypanosoma rangeli TaxID=5698 RepID=A0A3R7JZ70_TRYRA|nr:uncharacterized protein TraAM80_08320 [Trypanosoma rangeli]RNE99217.1 hypothetical protein TraAM80_08320 [Trypanosoma rangeli]|eukprot:RNE99217.1 hypothetical protein TraAM80_08320 [Trypanosoma rangeli]
MFRGLLGGAGRQWRSERRLATVMKATSRNPAQRSTYRISRTHLAKQSAMRIKGDAKRNQNRAMTPSVSCSDLSYADVEFLRSQQDEALAEHDARVRASARDAGIAQRHRSFSVSPQYLRYSSVDSTSGNSIIQERFDALVHDAVLKYGPPLPAEFVSENDVVTPFGSRDNSGASASSSNEDPGVCYFYDEVEIRPQELFGIIRRLDPLFSVRTHADGVPFSLLIKNCPYLRVWGGKVHFMRCLRRLSLRTDGDGEGDEVARGEVTTTLSKYKMREPPSFDGIRQGPQPWMYNYRMM